MPFDSADFPRPAAAEAPADPGLQAFLAPLVKFRIEPPLAPPPVGAMAAVLIREAMAKIADPEDWCKGRMHRRVYRDDRDLRRLQSYYGFDGLRPPLMYVPVPIRERTQSCAMGALKLVWDEGGFGSRGRQGDVAELCCHAMHAAARERGFLSMPEFNDARTTGHGDVLAAMARAAEIAEEGRADPVMTHVTLACTETPYKPGL